MINQKRKKNILYSTLLLVSGISLSLLSVFFLHKSTESTKEQESALVAKEDACKSSAISQGYSMKETSSNVFLEKESIKPEKYMFQLIELNSIFLQCSSLSLEKACVGSGCELSEKKDDNEDNISNNNKINVSITLGK